MRPTRLKRILEGGKPSLGMWVTLEAPTVSEIAALMGLDWIVIDTEHGHLDMKEVMEHVRATRGTETTPLVRIQEIEQGLIKRVLDIGAEGILVPMVRSAEDVERAVKFAKYPPVGVRGIGAERATHWGMRIPSYTRGANRNTIVVPIIETVEAAKCFDEILEVPGVDAIFFGPYDFAASAGQLGVWSAPTVMPQILAMEKRARAAGIPCGILTANENEARLRRRQGFRMLAIAFDTMLVIRGVRRMMAALGQPLSSGVSKVWHGG